VAKNLRIVLYSGGQDTRNALIHQSLLALGQGSDDVRMTYIPVWSQNSGLYFERFRRRYRRYGATTFHCLAVDQPGGFDRREAERTILNSDIVYLAGGNTFHFLSHLRRTGVLAILRRFGERGGVLAGLSAGALILTPNIGLAAYPAFDCDENEVGLTNRRALGLVDFEFFPHFRNSKRYRTALTRYSRRSGRPVYACRDGSGVVIEEDRFTAHGEVWLFHGGQSLKIAA